MTLGVWAIVTLGDWASLGDWAIASLEALAIESRGVWAIVNLGSCAIVTLETTFNRNVKR